jgi:hypothetical protein
LQEKRKGLCPHEFDARTDAQTLRREAPELVMKLLLVTAVVFLLVLAFAFGWIAGTFYVWRNLKSAMRSIVEQGLIEIKGEWKP